ncbi:MAG: membrane protein insertion efficiency factor YidD [Verrucomicrobia bacterium]|nr:membrane protein insertion efficiency factor YidD [Verrucomicrobiota bacterium]MDA1066900.1 membrane protein insertion efficiency factor YidD [Verrucomicrobiota bacterium]
MNPINFHSILRFPRYIVVGLVFIYQHVLSPIKNALLGPGGCCRFHPTCSEYTLESVKAHGTIKGLYFSIIRLSKCQPFHGGGYDPVKPVTSRFQPLPQPESLLDLRSKT